MVTKEDNCPAESPCGLQGKRKFLLPTTTATTTVTILVIQRELISFLSYLHVCFFFKEVITVAENIMP